MSNLSAGGQHAIISTDYVYSGGALLMNHIPSKWLVKLRWVFILYCSHFIFVYLYLGLRYNQWSGAKEFPLVIPLMVGIQLIYEVYATLSLVREKPFMATSITTGFMLIETGVILNPTGVYTSPYIAASLIFAFVTGALGWLWPLVQSLLYIIFYVFGIAGFLTSTKKVNDLLGLVEITVISVIGIVGYFFWRRYFDLSENSDLTKLNSRLKNQAQESTSIIESISDGVISFDTKGNIDLINPSAAALTGWSVKDAVGMNILAVMKLSGIDNKPLPPNTDLFAETIKTRKHISEILTLDSRDKKKTVISLAISPVIVGADESVGGVAVFRDVTKEQEAEKARSDFISTASHEMRTPVAAIEGYLALALNDKVSTIDSRARSFLEKAHLSTQSLGKLFQDLLTSAKADDGRLSNHPTAVEMSKFLEDISNDLRFTAQKKGLTTDFMLGSSQVIDARAPSLKVLPPLYYVYADPDRLREVITNLFDNAVKYTEQGKITIGLTADPNNVQFYIKDMGAGIAADDVPHLFQKFYRVDNSATRSIGGTGLGLFISKKIIELYRGQIWVESELGKGSTFFVNLPRLDTQKAEQIKQAEAANSSPLSS